MRTSNWPSRCWPRASSRCRPIHCTSGTTGTPKGVFSGLLSTADAEALVAEDRDLWGLSPDDVNLVLSPLHHSAPLRFAMGTLLPGRFDPERIAAALHAERPDHDVLPADSPAATPRSLGRGGRSRPLELPSRRARRRALPTCAQAPGDRSVSSRVDVGVLRLDRGPVQAGHDPVARSGGVNVYPLEVENALREVPGVHDVGVFGMPDPGWGQRVCAAVVGTASETDLREHAIAVLAPAKRPKTYVHVAELPLTTTGKVRRDQLPGLLG